MARNFYVVLGVSSDADPGQIRKAYRRLVKLYHPDHADQPVDKFHEVQKAYETLKDEESRRSHDRSLHEKSPPPPGQPLVISRRPRGRAVERRQGPSLREEIEGLFSSVDEFFDGWVPGLFDRTGLKSTHRKNLYVELILESDEARTGGLFPLQVPAEQACAECDGSGIRSDLECPACHGSGRSVTYHEIEVSVPPGVEDGTQARLSLGDIGLEGVDLFVLITVKTR